MAKFSLTEAAKIIRSEIFLIILGVISISLFSVFIFLLLSSKDGATGTKTLQIPWKQGTIPGETTTQKLKSKLGNPSKIEGSTYYYPSTNPKRSHLVEVQQDKVALVIEQVISKERGSLKDYLTKFGPPNGILYGKHETAAPGHFWGERGILVFGNDNSGLIIEIWYFKPTTLEQFLAEHPELKTQPTRNF